MARTDAAKDAPATLPARSKRAPAYTRNGNRWKRLLPNMRVLVGAASIVLGLVIWQVLSVTHTVSDLVLPPVTGILRNLGDQLVSSQLYSNLWATAEPFALGLLISIVGGTAIGVLMGLNTYIAAALNPWVIAFNSVPRIAFVPMLIVMFGIDFEMHVVVVISVGVIPVIINMYEGVKAVDRELLEMTTSFRATRRYKLVHVQLPFTAPFFISGVRTTLGLALVGEIIAEFFAANKGLGYALNQATQIYDMQTAYSMIIFLAALGILLAQLLRLVERRVRRWNADS
jgi:NitT/TauT family transport system permease protein